jgi:monovalent cation:proton antiporter-2 (CPA2) family protein
VEYESFFIKAVIYLLATVISVPIAKRLGFGSVLGYLLAGIVIGPFGLGLVGDHSRALMHFAEFGIVMMLFLIGLELRPRTIWQLRGQILGLGMLQVLATTLVTMLAMLVWGFTFTVAFVIGMIFSLSSTAIVMQIFKEKGWIQTPVGQSTFSVLLFQDLAVIPILALMPLLPDAVNVPDIEHHSWINQLSDGMQVLVTFSVIAALVLSGRFLFRPLFRYIAQSQLREVFTAASLLLVIANALVMELIGLSPALGTFIAGALLAESEYRHELEADIEPFKGLLMGLFFIAIGAIIDFRLVLEAPLFILGMLATLVFAKALVLFVLAKIFKLDNQNSILFMLSLAQGGEFCFVLISHAVTNQVVGPELGNQLIFIVTMSMILTPLMMIFYEKVVMPYYDKRQVNTDYDTIENKKNPVIIAGFGRFGQIVGRLLIASKIKATVLDLDADQIDIIRKFGFKVFYGDASRFDLLQSAGIEHAKLLIIAIDDSAKALEIALHVREHFPDIQILSRVRGRTEAYEFLGHDLHQVYRETFESSLRMGVDALVALGKTRDDAKRLVSLFREHDEAAMLRLFKLYGDDEAYINEAKQSRINLEKALSSDLEERLDNMKEEATA